MYYPGLKQYTPRKGRGEWKNGPKWVKSRCPGARERDMSLKPGDEISYVFGPNDPPPWYDLDAPRFARPRTDKENVQETNRRKKAREKLLKRKQQEDPLATLSPEEEESLQTNDTTKYPRIPGRLWVHTPHTTHHTPHTTHHTPHTTHHTPHTTQVTSDRLRGRNRCCGNSVTGNPVSRWRVVEEFSESCRTSNLRQVS